MLCSLGLTRITSVPGLAWHISRTWNFRARQQGAGMETGKPADTLHTCASEVSQQASPAGLAQAHLVQGHWGSCLFLPTALVLIKHAGKTL